MDKNLVFESDFLMKSLKKVNLCIKDSIFMQVKTVNNVTIASLTASDLSSQVISFVPVKCNFPDSYKCYLPKEIITIVNTIATEGSEVEFSDKGTHICVCCGNSSVAINKVDTASLLNIEDLNGSFQVSVASEALKAAAYKGGFAFSRYGTNMDVVNNICILPSKNADQYVFRLVSLEGNGSIAAESEVPVVPQNNEIMDAFVDKEFFVVDGNFFMKALDHIDSDSVRIFANEKQLIIKHNDLFCCTRKNVNYPIKQVLAQFAKSEEINYQFECDNRELKKAADIAVLNGKNDEEKKLVVLSLSKDGLRVESRHGKNYTVVKTTIKGVKEPVKLGLDITLLKNILDHSATKITVTNKVGCNCLFFSFENESSSFIFPISL